MENNILIFDAPKGICPTADKSNNNEYNYAISMNELKILHSNICNELRWPTVIIDFGDNKRIDSKFTEILLNYFCETFRNCAGTNLCEMCDECHAIVFKDINLTKNHLNDEVESRLSEHKNAINNSAVMTLPTYIPYHQDSKNRGYLEYDCPISGLRELIFPIIVENNVIGVLFVGQLHIINGKYEKYINKVRSEFIKKYGNIFDDYFKKFPKTRRSSMYKELLRNDDPKDIPVLFEPLIESINGAVLGKKIPRKIDTYEYDNLIDAVKNEVSILEYSLDESLKKRRMDYIKDTVNNAKIGLHGILQQEIASEGDNSLLHFWASCEDVLSKIIVAFRLESMSVFVMNPSKKRNNSYLELTVFASNGSVGISPEILKENIIFDYCNLDLDITQIEGIMSTTGLMESDNSFLYRAVKQRVNKIDLMNFLKYSDVFFYPVRKNLEYSIACIVKYIDSTHYNDKSGIKSMISSEITTLVQSMMAVEYFLLNYVTKMLNEKVLRIYRHEISHLALGLRSNNERYLGEKRPKNLEPEKIKKIYQDNESSLSHLVFLTQNMGVFINAGSNLENSEINIFGDIIFKWSFMNHETMYMENKEFVFPNVYEDEDARPHISGDAKKIDQIVYNLVSNAIKYSYWGTRIYIDCKRFNYEREGKKYLLTIISYGCEMENSEKPYELYYRGVKNEEMSTEGSGIGLYVAKEVATQIKSTLRHKCEKISDYNVPLIRKYLEILDSGNKNFSIIKNVCEELEKANIFEEVCSSRTDYREIKNIQVKEEVFLPLYKTKFEVTI
ncbi:MAG: ATP-binding protein [Firmicutes bacterium]|nr:ATP-binding protein [Bacillota bacterium]